MRFRQVHLDFHTSPLISGIGEKFNKKEWQETLLEARVDSITCFSCCHHGWSYHPTKVGRMHPNLKFDLLRAQVDACHEAGIRVPVYVSGGFNEMIREAHPEWQACDEKGFPYSEPFGAFFHKLCFNTDYMDFLCDLLRETATLFRDADGIFIDIISQGPCCCPKCLRDMREQGYDPENLDDSKRFARKVLLNYYRRTVEAIHEVAPDMPIFHNSGNIPKWDREILPWFSHLELESLPTGGWGYDHYPMSAAFCRNLGMEFLGMTGKFHTTWGEFGGFKSANALRYECAAMIANGSKCSIGDQLHPSGRLDASTYRIIGEAYRGVEQKEAWCDRVTSGSEIALMGVEGTITDPLDAWGLDNAGDIGASRVLQELHLPFDYVRPDMDLSRYRMLVLPDRVRLTPENAAVVNGFIARGGKVVLSGTSGMKADADEFVVDIGADYMGENVLNPSYIRCAEAYAPEDITTPFVVYSASRRIKAAPGVKTLGEVYDPYFQRAWDHFCSHQHTPYRLEGSGFAAGTLTGQVLYFAHEVFSVYRGFGSVALRQFIGRAISALAGEDIQICCDMPSQGRVTFMNQEAENRGILHLLYANTILRGGVCTRDGHEYGRPVMEIIEDLNPCPAVHVSLRVSRAVRSVTLEPSGEALPFTVADGRVELTVPSFVCHQMVVLRYR